MKIYLIGIYDDETDDSNVQSINNAEVSYESARKKVLELIDKTKNNPGVYDFVCKEDELKYHWTVSYKKEGYDCSFEWCYRIEIVELNVDGVVPEIRVPELEKRCESLQKHNDELKTQLAEYKKAISAAQCYLTFYDGGIYEDFDHLLQNVNKAKHILRMDEHGNTHILELFEGWKKNEH